MPTAPLPSLLQLAEMLGVVLAGLTARTAQGRVIRIQEQGQEVRRPEQEQEIPSRQEQEVYSRQEQGVPSRQEQETPSRQEQDVGSRTATPPLPDSQGFRSETLEAARMMSSVTDLRTQEEEGKQKQVLERGNSQEQTQTESPVNSPEPDRPVRSLEQQHIAPFKPSLLQSLHRNRNFAAHHGSQRQEVGGVAASPRYLGRARSPSSPPPGPQARVVVCDSVLMDIMEVKKEVVEDEVVKELEGREEEQEGEDEEEEDYPDMDNYGRNYVCIKCSKGFTFAKSFNWHSSRCEVSEGRGRPTENSAGKRVSLSSGSRERSETPKKEKSETPRKERSKLAGEVHSPDLELTDEVEASDGEAGREVPDTVAWRPSLQLRKKIDLYKKVEHNVTEVRRKEIVAAEGDIKVRLKRTIVLPAKLAKSPRTADVKCKIASTKNLMKKKVALAKQVVLAKGRKEQVLPIRKVQVLPIRKEQVLKSTKGQVLSISKGQVLPLSRRKEQVVAPGRLESLPPPARSSCGRCVKCLLPDCGQCPACLARGGKAMGLRGCVRKVCREKGRRAVSRRK